MDYFVESDSALEFAFININETLDYVYRDFYNRFKGYNFPAMIVVNNDRIFLGILTEKDLQKCLAANQGVEQKSIQLKDFYNPNCKRITYQEFADHKKNNMNPFENLPSNIRAPLETPFTRQKKMIKYKHETERIF
jgi:hypothetical protein